MLCGDGGDWPGGHIRCGIRIRGCGVAVDEGAKEGSEIVSSNGAAPDLYFSPSSLSSVSGSKEPLPTHRVSEQVGLCAGMDADHDGPWRYAARGLSSA